MSCWVRVKIGHEKPDCQLIEKIVKKEWLITKSEPRKKNANAQQIETSDDGAS